MLVRISARLGNTFPTINREEPTEIIVFDRILFIVKNINRKVVGGHPISINNSAIYGMRKYWIEVIDDLPALKLLAQRFIRKITAITFTLLNDFEGSIIGVLSHGAAPNKSSERFQISIAETAVFSTLGCNAQRTPGKYTQTKSIQPGGLSIIKTLDNSNQTHRELLLQIHLLNFKRAYFEDPAIQTSLWINTLLLV